MQLSEEVKNLRQEIDRINQRRIYQTDIVPGGVKPIHLFSADNSVGIIPSSDDGANFSPQYLSAFSLPSLYKSKYIKIYGSSLTIGDTDLYTVPVGRKCFIGFDAFMGYNETGGTVGFYPQIKINDSYFRMLASQNVTTANAVAESSSHILPMVLNAGESFSIHCATTAGFNFWIPALEFDEQETRLGSGRVINLASGNNTLYTVPHGKCAIPLQIALGSASSSTAHLRCSNGTGGTVAYIVYILPQGAVAGLGYKIGTTASTSTLNVSFHYVRSVLSEGDSLVVNTDSGDAGQMAWFPYFEIPNS